MNHPFPTYSPFSTAPASTIVIAASNSANASRANRVCTGVNDDVAINAALAAISTNGGKVTLLEGTYNVYSNINLIGNNVTLEGMGAGTFIQNQGTNWFSGTPIIQMGGTGGASYQNLKVRNLNVQYSSAGGTNITLYGIGASSNASFIEVTGNTLQVNQAGVIIVGVANFIVSNNFIYSIGDEGIQTNGVSGGTIVNNVSTTTGTFRTNYDGIRLLSSTNVAVVGNTCYNWGGAGIRCGKNSNYNTIVGNNLHGDMTKLGTYGGGPTGDAAEIIIGQDINGGGNVGNSTYNVVVGNNIHCTTTNALYGVQELGSGNDYNYYANNLIVGATTANYNLLGIHSRKQDQDANLNWTYNGGISALSGTSSLDGGLIFTNGSGSLSVSSLVAGNGASGTANSTNTLTITSGIITNIS